VPDEAVSPLFFPQPAYALIIGISEYAHCQPADDKNLLEPENFRALNFAAKDAEDFATFLRENGFLPDNIVLLRNEEATLKNIKIEFAKVIAACKAADANEPLVILYFSGHGFAEDENQHYLVPYDGERNQLFATAMSNGEFNSLLEGVKTPKLVAFLDCCRAGGMVGMESKGAKGQAAPVSYDFPRGLGGGSGRIVIASCKRGEESYESGGNGIFTGKLLELLGGRSPHFADEEIRIFPLYERLRDEVFKAAGEKHGKRQEPQINRADEATGIVLAINQKAKRLREDREKGDRERREGFLIAVITKLRDMSTLGPASTIAWKLDRYVRRRISEEGNEPLYRLFDENLGIWNPGDWFIVDTCCKILFDVHAEVIETIRSKSKVGSSAGPLDRLEPASRPSLVNPPSPHEPSAPPPLSDQQTLRRTPESELRTAKLDRTKE
jgi:hypothetical protein